MVDKKLQGKKNGASGAAFELKVRKDLESKSWIVAKWSNNVEFENIPDKVIYEKITGKNPIKRIGKLISAKHKFRGMGIPMAIGTGFPDFIAYKNKPNGIDDIKYELMEIMGVEVKSNGYLTKEEREKCKWLLDNHIFSKILIAKKGEKRGEIVYTEWKTE